MGRLNKFPIEVYSSTYGLKAFLETGTYKGDGLNYALSHNCFEFIQSVESSPNHQPYIHQYTNTNIPIIALWRGFSEHCLPGMVSLIGNSPCLFWLDAHLPTFYGEPPTGHDIPLKNELSIIFEHRSNMVKYDAFIIDDLRIFEDGPYASGNMTQADWDKLGVPPMKNDGWLDLFFQNHNTSRKYEDEGYYIALPAQKIS